MNDDPDDVLDDVIEPEELGENIQPIKTEYPEQDNWAGDPEQAWA